MAKDTRIDHIETCRDGDHVSFMVHLHYGWQLDGSHTFGEDSKALIKKTMQRVVACCCRECREHLERP